MVRSADIRQQFLDFFVEREHRLVPSSPIIPASDPTLLFTSAGMVQFKPYYSSSGKLDFTRATSAQKCFRVTDLEQVGHTPRHCTFFEMLGNFSFGDYFKREAIAWAWEFCIDGLGMPADRIWASVYQDDDEAAALWEKEIGLPASRIVRLGKEDNFWGPAGSTGACGPSSELYFDLGPEFGPDSSRPGDEHDRFQEFWNLVFPQFNQDEGGNLAPLARKGIDTGMGLERLVQILNGQGSVFETDAFRPIIERAADMSGADPDADETRIPLRVVAEHARALTVAVSEGVYPGNEGRGYVVRRLLRRAARRGHILGLNEPFLYQLSGVVVDLLGSHYTDLVESRDRVATIIKSEEERFATTLHQGMNKFEEIADALVAGGGKTIRGADAFLLYDTYGFPVDMTREMAEERGLAVDEPGFESEMTRQVERSRAASRFDNAPGETEAPWTYLDGCDASTPHSEFTGYEALSGEVRMVARRPAGDAVEFLLDRTPFYPEGGGQVTDSGVLESGDGRIEVERVRRTHDDEIVHRGRVVKGEPSPGPWSASIDEETRRSTERNHTATHLLHAALRQVLGTHVTQAGSLVSPDRLRFDFTHFAPISEAQKSEIESLANREILADKPVDVEFDSLDAARAKGAMALFGEKYGDIVRQVVIPGFSRELCGGTHVRRTGEIGAFRVTLDESISAGTRRVEVSTGWKSLRRLQDDEGLLSRVADLVRAPRPEIEEKVQHLVEENERLRRELEKQKAAAVNESAGALMDQVIDVAGIRFIAAEVPAESVNHLREAADRIRADLKSGVAVLGARFDGKAAFVATATDDVVKKGVRADQLVRDVAKIAGGSGGGRPNMATAGARHPDKLEAALAAASGFLEKQAGLEKA